MYIVSVKVACFFGQLVWIVQINIHWNKANYYSLFRGYEIFKWNIVLRKIYA